ncbi:pyridoxal-dependent decarboxylase [Verticillium dahliae VdLs.17]|uniref:Pyridoxal-dependent decarboxylase n=1 Tax=Verticillium dahliae (strain VdLs.17 / ATCC MYA-4575 / FGSC 10137) TaxID=498257 RepID=G2WRK3_VERDV|nr:pyridoxal-dependent decarboxylase [Verticillium dahliae VdLs.17]EGY13504.1 pyridoxal-dependent decarboxylase [Verticillium dahliae VdLs.17]KAH6709957.1 pyridoxal-dependent decarboxylase [Verticillium dahliae]
MAHTSFDMQAFHAQIDDALKKHFPPSSPPTLPHPSALARAAASLPKASDALLKPLGVSATTTHLLDDIVPALSGQALSPRYYGFVTGSVHPVAQAAEAVVAALDQNVQVHLPDQTIATDVEASALDLLADLLGLSHPQTGAPRGIFTGRTFTTGATGSNILGLACAREHVLARRVPPGSPSVGELGILGACVAAGVTNIQVLTSMGHSSLSKAASVVGLGRASVKQMAKSPERPWLLDVDAVERELVARDGTGVATIIAVTFGIFAAALAPGTVFDKLRERVSGVHLADSIAVDGHKLLNVVRRDFCPWSRLIHIIGVYSADNPLKPYDCGMFFTRSLPTLTNVFTNPNAAYLASSAGAPIPSPLNVGLENSRRFRALPAYAVLRSEGRKGMAAMLGRMVELARRIACFVRDSEHYDWLPDGEADVDDTHIIVLLRAKNLALNDELVARINETRDMYVSGTSWGGRKAVRVAIGSWRVDVERDFAVVEAILSAVAEGRPYAAAV